MKSFLILCVFLTLPTLAQRPQIDILETKKGPLSIQPINHASIVFTFQDQTIYIDPYGGAKAFAGLRSPDLILITDIHQDHLNLETLNVLNTDNTALIVPDAVAKQLPEKLRSKARVLVNGASVQQSGISISAIPMYNIPETADSKHPKGRGNGYLLRFEDKSIYISGDTGNTPEMRALKNIDVAFICMNLPYTMDVSQAADAVLNFKPEIVYPYHYRGKDGLSDIDLFKKLVEDGDAKTQVVLRNWYPEY